MGWYVHLHLCFSCNDNEPLAALARKHEVVGYDCPVANWLLRDLGQRSGTNPGPKGGLCLWGMIINGNWVEDFVTELRPFWTELLQTELDHEHILVFYEEEQSEAANAYEIYLDENRLIVKHHTRLPFTWMQM